MDILSAKAKDEKEIVQRKVFERIKESKWRTSGI